MKKSLFYAKVLLFGEYGIIENSKGLTIPYNFYKGTLKYSSTANAKKSNQHLQQFNVFLTDKFADVINVKQLQSDLNKNLFFDSDIPQGYGVGSSGALVAAIYDRYATNKISNQNISKEKLSELKTLFGEMETYFHGKSSGIDPLICYLNLPLLINSKSDIDTVGLPKTAGKQGAIFLINSGTPGETAPMVQIFFDKLKNDGFRKTLKEEFIKHNNACIESFIKGDFNPLFDDLKKLSTWALLHFKPMIPKKLIHAWETGINTNSYYLKLCGSGGGGFVLGFTQDYKQAQQHLNGLDTEVIFTF